MNNFVRRATYIAILVRVDFQNYYRNGRLENSYNLYASTMNPEINVQNKLMPRNENFVF